MKTSLNTVVGQLSFATSVAAALSITACSPRPQADSRVCTDGAGRRVADQNCQRSGGRAGGAYWYYGGRETARTGWGEKVSGGSYTAPARGGFGASARGSSGG